MASQGTGVSVNCQVRFFARLRELVGEPSIQLALGHDVDMRAVWRELLTRYPSLVDLEPIITPVKNLEVVGWLAPVGESDVLSFLTPVSGGSGLRLLELIPEQIDARRLEAAVRHPGAGAMVTFYGTVRNHSEGGQVLRMEYHAYEEMALVQLRRVGDEVLERWPEVDVAIAHRLGPLELEEVSVVVCVAAAHREQAFAACKYGIDRLKQTVPIWKHEVYVEGSAWIEAEQITT